MLVEYSVETKKDFIPPVVIRRLFKKACFFAGRVYKVKFNCKQIEYERAIKQWVDSVPGNMIKTGVTTVKGEWDESGD